MNRITILVTVSDESNKEHSLDMSVECVEKDYVPGHDLTAATVTAAFAAQKAVYNKYGYKPSNFLLQDEDNP
jgi:hypothetical protein